VLLDVTLVYLTFLLAETLVSRKAGLLAAGVQAVTPVAVAAGCRVLSDSLFAFLLTAAVLLVIRHLRTSAWRSLIAAAVVTGAACYVRPVGMLFGVIVMVVLLFRERPQEGFQGRKIEAGASWRRIAFGGLSKPLRHAAVFVGLLGVMLLPWVLRNGLKADYWGFSSLRAEAAFRYQAPAILAKLRPMSLEDARREVHRLLPAGAHGRGHSPGELARRKLSVAQEIIRRHWWLSMSIHARGDLTVWLPGATEITEVAGITVGQKGVTKVLQGEGLAAAIRHYFHGRTWALWLCVPLVAIEAAKLLLAGAGALRHVRFRMNAACWLVLGTVLVFSLAPGPAGHPRFRVPIEPLLSLAASAGLVALCRAWRLRRQARPTITTD